MHDAVRRCSQDLDALRENTTALKAWQLREEEGEANAGELAARWARELQELREQVAVLLSKECLPGPAAPSLPPSEAITNLSIQVATLREVVEEMGSRIEHINVFFDDRSAQGLGQPSTGARAIVEPAAAADAAGEVLAARDDLRREVLRVMEGGEMLKSSIFQEMSALQTTLEEQHGQLGQEVNFLREAIFGRPQR